VKPVWADAPANDSIKFDRIYRLLNEGLWQGVCRWTYDADTDSRDTGCGQKHQFTDGGPAENRHDYCPYCGQALKGGNS
jgi:hypothetical protein